MSDDLGIPTPTPPAEGGRPGPASDTSKLLAALGYLIWIVALIAILIEPYKDEKFVRFHAIQALALNLVMWVAVATVIGSPISLVAFVFAVIALVKAFQAEYYEVPLIYGVVKSWVD